MTDIVDADLENTFKILLSTDNHLGYAESNPVRENDSFVTFEEILKIAVKEDVDFILLGGDLFHETRPSPYCINKCTELLRKYCLGDRPVCIELLSDPSYNFQSKNGSVNYEDPNLNVSIPIFSIHGNHDDPTGKRQVSALELLSSAGLVNYFGRWNDVTDVEVHPVLLQKGQTRLALYGLSHIRDERLARLFIGEKVKMKVPPNVNDFFNLMVLHQNRANRGVKNFIAESYIPDFMDLVMWGHEHDCKIKPVLATESRCYITQPGSSVATSLADGESRKKHVGLLRVQGKQFNLVPIELKTVRPFVMKMIDLPLEQSLDSRKTYTDVAQEKIISVIEEMLNEVKDSIKSTKLLPLLRLIVRYDDERQVFNTIRFGQQFSSKVANPTDMLKFKAINKNVRPNRVSLLGGANDDDINEEVDRVEDLLPKYFDEKNQLNLYSLNALSAAVKKYIDANDASAPADLTQYQEQMILKKLEELRPDEKGLAQTFEDLKEARQTDDYQTILDNPNRPKATANQNPDIEMITLDDSDNDAQSSVATERPATGPGSRGGRGSRRGRGSRGPRAGRGK